MSLWMIDLLILIGLAIVKWPIRHYFSNVRPLVLAYYNCERAYVWFMGIQGIYFLAGKISQWW